MDSFNKVISFVLGLVVVLVFLAVITGRINLRNKSTSTSVPTPTPIQKNTGFFGFFKSANPTPTPFQKQQSITINTNMNKNNQVAQYSNAKSIPSTGLPTLFIPILLSGLIGGNFLKKIGKK